MSSATPDQPADPLTADALEDVVARKGAHPVLVYTLLRVLLLAVVGGVLYLLGLRGVWLLMFAFLLSGVLSIFVLNRRREVAAATVVGAVQKVNERIDESASAEDSSVAAPTVETSTADESGTPVAPPQKRAQPRRRDEIPPDDDLD